MWLVINAHLTNSEPRRIEQAGLTHLRRGERDAARKLLEQTQELHPASGHSLLLGGHYALLVKRDAQAAESLYSRAAVVLGDESPDAYHSIGRLLRQQQRWDEADEQYALARAVAPSSTEIVEEALFVRGKRLAMANEPQKAALTFERGLTVASATWKPHFAREAGHCAGLCGDFESASRNYRMALTLGGLPDHAALGDLFSKLAIHHEQRPDLPTAVDFLRGAREAFNASACQHGAAAAPSKAATAHARMRLAQMEEGLYALGERWGGQGGGGGGATTASADEAAAAAQHQTASPSSSHDDLLPTELEGAARQYEAALALDSTLADAYDSLAALLLGTSRLCNFGAQAAAALNTQRARNLLTTARELAGGGEDEASDAAARTTSADSSLAANAAASTEVSAAQLAAERRDAMLETITRTELEVEGWRQVTERGAPPSARVGASRDASSSTSSAWSVPEALRHAPEVPRATVSDASELNALVANRRPVVLTNLQADAGFAPREAWSATALAQAAGEHIVKVSTSQSRRFDGAEDGALWGLPGDEVLVRPPETHMRLADLLTLLSWETDEAFYLEYNALHQYLGDTLRRMAPTPHQASSLRPLLTNLWLGKGATTSPLHYDEYENLLSQVSGSKELLLFPPEDYEHLEYRARPKGILRYAWPATFTREPIGASAREARVVFAASINMTHPDAKRKAALKRCSPLRCKLQPGETLLLPAYWHHEVYSHPASSTEDACSSADEAGQGRGQSLNVAVNFWFRNESAPPPEYDYSS